MKNLKNALMFALANIAMGVANVAPEKPANTYKRKDGSDFDLDNGFFGDFLYRSTFKSTFNDELDSLTDDKIKESLSKIHDINLGVGRDSVSPFVLCGFSEPDTKKTGYDGPRNKYLLRLNMKNELNNLYDALKENPVALADPLVKEVVKGQVSVNQFVYNVSSQEGMGLVGLAFSEAAAKDSVPEYYLENKTSLKEFVDVPFPRLALNDAPYLSGPAKTAVEFYFRSDFKKSSAGA
ncbi:MAG: hypothetical protein ACP5N3_04520 [Candidatus Nanoarchaeia archaeon]